MTRCIELDRSCADLCALVIRELTRDSEFAEGISQLCAEACDACAHECGKHEMDHCQACAHACRVCAEACREMAGVSFRHR